MKSKAELLADIDRVTAERDAALNDVSIWKRKACESAEREEITNRNLDRMIEHSDELQQRLTAADERSDAAIAFVTRLIERAGGQPSIATGYLRDILAALKPAEVPYVHSGEDDFGHREREQ